LHFPKGIFPSFKSQGLASCRATGAPRKNAVPDVGVQHGKVKSFGDLRWLAAHRQEKRRGDTGEYSLFMVALAETVTFTVTNNGISSATWKVYVL